MKLTVFAGTFNPIHTAHLIIAEYVREELKAEKILFIPSFIPPHKNNGIINAEHRFNMVKLAIADNPHFQVSAIEIKLGGASYTYNTVCKLYEQNTNLSQRINFIIGADALCEINSWYNPDKLVKMVNFIAISRPKSKKIKEIIGNISLNDFSYKFIEAPEIDISSSFVRDRIKERKSVRYLISEPVEKYIKENNLYKNEKSY